MGLSKKWIVPFSLSALLYALPTAWSQDPSSAFLNQYGSIGQNVPYNTGPATFSAMPGMTDMLNGNISACAQNSRNSAIMNGVNSLTGLALDQMDVSTGSCSDVCTKPEDDPAPKCTDYVYKNGSHHTLKSDKKASDAKKIGEDFGTYANCLKNKKKNKCAGPDQKALQQNVQALQCQMNALNQAEAQAAQVLQSTLSQNQTQFNKMNQYEGEVNSQVEKVTTMLNGDPKHPESAVEFKGLLGIQDAMDKDLGQGGKISQDESDFATQAATIKNEYQTNDDNMEALRMQNVTSCLTVVPVTQCYRPAPAVDATGKPTGGAAPPGPSGHVQQVLMSCSPLDLIKSKLRETQLVNANGQLMAGEDQRQNDADAIAARFDLIASKIVNAMAPNEGPGGDQKKPLVGSSTQDWASVENQIAGELAGLPPIVVNGQKVSVKSELDQFAGPCFTKGDTWETNQKKKPGTDYSKEVQRIDKEKRDMLGKTQQDMEKMKRYFTAASSILAGVPTDWTGFKCDTTDPDKAVSCLQGLHSKLTQLQHGTTGSFVTQQIPGGSMVSGGYIRCSGIDTCVTVLKGARDKMDGQLDIARKYKTDFVNKGNAQITQQMQGFAQNLQAIQSRIDQQYAALAAQIRKGGGTGVPPALTPVKGEALKPAEPSGSPPAPGPLQPPESMVAALSKFVTPGLVDASNSGLDKAMDAVQESIDKANKDNDGEMADATKAAKAYADIAGTCDADTGPGSGDSVGNQAATCANVERTCEAKNSSDSTPVPSDQLRAWVTAMNGYYSDNFDKSADDNAAWKNVKESMKGMGGDGECYNAIQMCDNFMLSKHIDFGKSDEETKAESGKK